MKFLQLTVFAIIALCSTNGLCESIQLHGLSHHYQQEDHHNEQNWGIGYRYKDAQFGVYLNTHNRWTAYGVNLNGEKVGDLEIGYGYGVAIGYEDYPVLPTGLVYAEYKDFTLYIMPNVASISYSIYEFD